MRIVGGIKTLPLFFTQKRKPTDNNGGIQMATNAKKLKQATITFKLSDEEKEQLQDAALAKHLSLSCHLRRQLFLNK